jgi:predicted ABC-type ATPase
MASPQVLVIGGPNGAGKTTSSRRVFGELLGMSEFVNADVIAAGLSAFDPDSVALTAGRIMLSRLRQLAEARANFAFETTLATRTFAPWIAELRATGYESNVLYVWLRSPSLAIERVRSRVLKGGHHVPDETVRRRYYRSLHNLVHLYIPIADRYTVTDNSDANGPVLVASGTFGSPPTVYEPRTWARILREAEHGDEKD